MITDIKKKLNKIWYLLQKKVINIKSFIQNKIPYYNQKEIFGFEIV